MEHAVENLAVANLAVAYSHKQEDRNSTIDGAVVMLVEQYNTSS